MINGFPEQTKPLTQHERQFLLPTLIGWLGAARGRENAITSKEMMARYMSRGWVVSDARIRKLVRHIRIKKTIKYVIATSIGYYVIEDRKEIEKYLQGLKDRILATIETYNSFGLDEFEPKQGELFSST